MLKLGEIQTLQVLKKVNFGVYLTEQEDHTQVLLPAREVPEGTEVGDDLSVFLYKDSEDRLIATTNPPEIKVGEIGILSVASVGKIGAFLKWGLPKDLLLPYREQTAAVEKGKSYGVALYVDKSQRLCATMKLYEHLSKDTPYHVGDMVEGIVYDISKNFGVFVAVDCLYSAKIPKREDFGSLKVGDRIKARVTRVLEDGKMDLSVREKSYLQLDEDCEILLKELKNRKGILPFSDKADPELIKEELHMSKAAFKRAAGRLMKQGKVSITPQRIILRDLE